MKNSFHQEILTLIIQNSSGPTQHTFSDSYLGNSHPRYPINAPAMRALGKAWMRDHRDLPSVDFSKLLTSLIEGPSSTEKVMAGILMDYSTRDQRAFDPVLFDDWLTHLEGWAEVDAVCTGDYATTEIPAQWKKWKKLLISFSKDENIQKRRASLVLLCSTVRYTDDQDIANLALRNIDRLKKEKEVLITKAISWLLRSMIKNFKPMVSDYVRKNKETLPKIAVRETLTVLRTGKKTK